MFDDALSAFMLVLAVSLLCHAINYICFMLQLHNLYLLIAMNCDFTKYFDPFYPDLHRYLISYDCDSKLTASN